MIIYGSRAVHVKSEQSKTLTCANCATKGSIILSVFRRHAHVFWIPLFPLWKIGVSECSSCKHVVEKKNMPQDMRQEYNVLKETSRGPIWQFSGLIIICILMATVFWNGSENSKLEKQYIIAPEVGDVYRYKMDEEDGYSTLKVIKVTTDSVFVSPNMYLSEKRSKVYKIEKEGNYSEESYGISREEIRNMYVNSIIYHISR